MLIIMSVQPPSDDRAERIDIYYMAPEPVKELDHALIRGLERVGYTLHRSGCQDGKRDMVFTPTPPDQHIPHSNDPSTPPPQPAS